MHKIERRSVPFQVAEVRAAGEDKTRTIVGYAAIFYRAGDPATEFRVMDDFVERIHPGAFDAALREDDVRGLFDHRSDRVLGRRVPGVEKPTMRLSVDERGLKYEIDLPEHELGVGELIQRGDVTGSSFGFSAYVDYGAKRGRIVWEEVDGVLIRNVHDLTLYDVGPVTYPAYEGSTAEARSLALRDAPPSQAELREAEDRLLLASASS